MLLNIVTLNLEKYPELVKFLKARTNGELLSAYMDLKKEDSVALE